MLSFGGIKYLQTGLGNTMKLPYQEFESGAVKPYAKVRTDTERFYELYMINVFSVSLWVYCFVCICTSVRWIWLPLWNRSACYPQTML